jgi:dTDP-4-amino-4,6-dideoxygalactose transaminase
VYSDIELDTYGLDASLIQDEITANTKAILLHHMYGLVCRDYEKIMDIAKQNGLYVIEDCAQSTGALFRDQRVGNLGNVAFHSSEQSKVFSTIQGGVATTNDDLLAERLHEYRSRAIYADEKMIERQLYCTLIYYHLYKHPQRWWRGEWVYQKYRDKLIQTTTKQEERGIKPAYYGRKMPSPIAALGLNQLKKVDDYNQRRRQAARTWDEWCYLHGYKRPLIAPNSSPVYLRYPVMVEPEKKKDVSWAQRSLGVSPGVWFVSNIHPVDWPVHGCPNADQAVKQCINFPTLV